MVPEDLLFWIVATDTDTPFDAKLLCRRHADAMVVPRGWTLDDRRQPTPSLFQTRRYETRASAQTQAQMQAPPRVAATMETSIPPSTRRQVRQAAAHAVEQLQIDGTGPIARPSADVIAAIDEPDHTESLAERTEEVALETAVHEAATPDSDATNFSEWRPEFDTDDDLDGLLETKSPLLSRAFRGVARQR
ncbi:MAG TPA: hypothetical protein VMM60_13525 [Ilumatobacter sp.]|nr:hypothetical protein [Ilumatobacter sp.]